MDAKAHRRRPWLRWLAAFLALVIVFTFSAQSWIAVKITVDEHNAAQTYLAEQTEYANAGRLERLQTRLQTLSRPRTLEDYYRLAEIHIAAADYDRALPNIEQCLDLLGPEQGAALKAELLLKKGCLLTILGRGEEAVPAMEEVLQLAPDMADAYLVLAQIHAEAGDAGAAGQALAGYLEQVPQAADLRLLLAQLYLAGGDPEAAGQQADYLLAQGGAESQALAELLTGIGLALLQTEDSAGALTRFEAALALDDTVDSLCYYAGLCCLIREDYEAAVGYYSRAIEQGSCLQLSRYGRGAAELMLPHPDRQQAAEDLTFAAGYDQPDADPVVNQQAQALLDAMEE